MSQGRRKFKPGTTISGTNYRVIRFIGSGAMGAVYEVLHSELDKVFVVKVLHQDLLEHDDPVRRLRCEWRMLARLEHPNIVSVTDAGMTQEGIPFFVMERLHGETLLSRINREPRWPVASAVRLTTEILDGLMAAHAIGIVHRDIKPSNIFLTQRAGVKLLDFGIAKAFGTNATATARGVTLGTPRYMAPEQACGKIADFRSDLYALGVILYEIIAGQHPFAHAQTPVEMLIAQACWEPHPLSVCRLGLADELVALVAQLLSKDPNDRPASAALVRESMLRSSSRLELMQLDIISSSRAAQASTAMSSTASRNMLSLTACARKMRLRSIGIGGKARDDQLVMPRRRKGPLSRNRTVIQVCVSLLIATIGLSAGSLAAPFPIHRVLSCAWFSGRSSMGNIATNVPKRPLRMYTPVNANRGESLPEDLHVQSSLVPSAVMSKKLRQSSNLSDATQDSIHESHNDGAAKASRSRIVIRNRPNEEFENITRR